MTRQLIPVTPAAVGSETIPTVDARELHSFLEIKGDFSSWIKDQIKRARLIENKDFTVFLNNQEKGRPLTDYHLTIESAKHISMMSGADKGFEVRDYFIECERQAKAHAESPEQIMSRALRIADATMKKQVAYIAELEPKAAFYEAVASTSGLILIREAAKILAVPHMGQNHLYTILRGVKVLMDNNEPYQKYVNMEYFMVREGQYTLKSGEVRVSRTTMVTQKGLEFIRRLVVKNMKNGFFLKGPALWQMPDEVPVVS